MLVDERRPALGRDGRLGDRATCRELAIPPTIQALLAARLDQLAREEREVDRARVGHRAGVHRDRPWTSSRPTPIRAEVDAHLATLDAQAARPPDRRRDGGPTSASTTSSSATPRTTACSSGRAPTLHERFVDWAERVNRDAAARPSSRRSSATTSSRRTGTSPSSGRSTTTARDDRRARRGQARASRAARVRPRRHGSGGEPAASGRPRCWNRSTEAARAPARPRRGADGARRVRAGREPARGRGRDREAADEPTLAANAELVRSSSTCSPAMPTAGRTLRRGDRGSIELFDGPATTAGLPEPGGCSGDPRHGLRLGRPPRRSSVRSSAPAGGRRHAARRASTQSALTVVYGPTPVERAPPLRGDRRAGDGDRQAEAAMLGVLARSRPAVRVRARPGAGPRALSDGRGARAARRRRHAPPEHPQVELLAGIRWLPNASYAAATSTRRGRRALHPLDGRGVARRGLVGAERFDEAEAAALRQRGARRRERRRRTVALADNEGEDPRAARVRSSRQRRWPGRHSSCSPRPTASSPRSPRPPISPASSCLQAVTGKRGR